MRYYIYLTFLFIGTNEGVEQFDPCNTDFDTITDFSITDCKPGTFYSPKGNSNSKHSCFPTCIENIENIKEYVCNEENHGISELYHPCPPGYQCKSDDNKIKRCIIDKDSCFKYHSEINDDNNEWKNAIWKPECLPDGTWAPKQCKGDVSSGRCFCFDPVGKRIFGQEFFQENSTMTCACSRKRLKLTESGSYFYASLHCDSNGNYEELQCNGGNCWCVEPTTGEMISKMVPETMMKFLPCYRFSVMGEQYMRKCESEEYAQAQILHTLGIHGTSQSTFEHLLCDADGSYGSFKITNGIVTCKWRDNSNFNAAGPVISKSELNCNCVRDTKIFENAGLGNHGKQCSGTTGSYNPVQQLSNGKYYCVDSDGYRSSEYLDVTNRPDDKDCEKYNL